MLKISDFAKIAQISTSALRYYDEIGIFKPVHVDVITGYRYYAIDQLVRLNRILALKDLGIDLTEIVQLLDDDLSPKAFHGMLRLRQAQLRQNIQLAQEQLARIDARISYIERGGGSTVPEVVLKPVKSMTVAASMTGVTGLVPNLEYADRFITLLRKNRLKPNGYTHYLYHRNPSAASGHEVEVAIPVEGAEREGVREQIAIRQLPDVVKMASALHRGSPYDIVEAFQAIGRWIQENAYTIAGPTRKVCLHTEGDLREYLTEIQFPVEIQADSATE